MRFISIREAAGTAGRTAARFPWVLLAAAVVTVAGQIMVGVGGRPPDSATLRAVLAGLLGLPLFTAIQTATERAGWSRRGQLFAGLVATILPAGFWLLADGWTEALVFTRFLHLLITFHLLAAVLPFVGVSLHRAFWQYNRILFIRFLIATLFAGVLFAGLAIALLAIDNLFGVDIDDDTYVRLWIVVAFVFHPWIFLSGVPQPIAALEERADYPAGLKVFAQFILIPVVTIYLLILTAYLVRVLVTRTWPNGWIGWLVSSVSAAGTLALLLVHPVRERADNRWVDAYGRWFFILLLPSIAMLLMAIWQRVEQYGLTERRYFLAILALWLAAIALFYAITASRNIRVIPATLCLVGFLIFAGPWSAYAVSRRSQTARLNELLVRNEMLADGRLQPPPANMTFLDRREINATVHYLVRTHGASSLRAISDELARVEPDSTYGPRPEDDMARAVIERLGLPWIPHGQTEPLPQYFQFFAQTFTQPYDIAGFQTMVRVNVGQTFTLPLPNDSVEFRWIAQPPRWDVRSHATEVLSITLAGVIAEARRRQALSQVPSRLPPEQPPIIVEAESGGLHVRALIISIAGEERNDSTLVHSGEAFMLVRRR